MQLAMISLGVFDVARSLAFYLEMLGLVPEGPGGGEVAILQAGGGVRLVLNAPAGRAHVGPLAGSVEVIFAVPHVEDAHRELTQKGCVFLREPREIYPGTWGATFLDPDGHMLTLTGSK
jgi:predicted enzyme related to lactoylglutathione lyase